MACQCNENPFKKLRECWSRHYKNNMQGGCDCCCAGLNTKPKVKGKFGLAYVIDTPNRTCKPCGWEVEFNDTLSEVENNCKKMMTWVTCPPLGEFENNRTTMCCCSKNAEQFLNNVQQPCCCQCKRKEDKDLCSCCKPKNQQGDCCCCIKKQQKQSSCCKAPSYKTRCCPKTNDNSNRCCCKNPCSNGVQRKTGCCKATKGQNMYLQSKKCAECCCIVPNADRDKQCCCAQPESYSDEDCCCNKTKNEPMCCCNESNESSTESCACNKPSRREECRCDCSCSGCQCITGKSKHNKSKNKNRNDNRDRHNGKNDTTEIKDTKDYDDDKQQKHSKNSMGPEPKKERYKNNEKSPFTISTREVPKEPDKQNRPNKDFQEELNQKILDIAAKNVEEKKDASNGVVKKHSMLQVEMDKNYSEYKSEENLEQVEKDKEENLSSKQNSNEHKKSVETIKPTRTNEQINLGEEVENPKPTFEPVEEASEKPKRKRRRNKKGHPSIKEQIQMMHRKQNEAIHPTHEK